MLPTLALLLWGILVLALFRFDRAKQPKTSRALWVPVIWLFFLGSRTPASWLGIYGASDRVQALEQGNPFDRTILSLLLLAVFAILVSRSFQWGKFAAQNSALILWLTFPLLSVAWSDFPFAAFKKWFRDMGVYMAVLVVLSDPRPLIAVRTVLRRVSYLIIPLSILLIKYYPHLGMKYSVWGGQEYTGVSTSKNMLGILCMVSGLFFFWDTIQRWHQRSEVRVRQVIRVNIAFIAMILWLLNLSDSKTSTLCMAFGCLVIAAAHCSFGRRHPKMVKALGPLTFILYLILTVGLGMGAQLSQAVGRSATMSDRTRIWQVVLSVPINPVLGTGYQSFWLGWRVPWVWERLTGDNVLQAHNGYLETYLELGLIGLLILCTFLIATYRKICKQLDPLTPLGSLGLGLWDLLVFCNVTMDLFGANVVFIMLLMGSLTAPQGAEVRAHASPAAATRGCDGVSICS